LRLIREHRRGAVLELGQHRRPVPGRAVQVDVLDAVGIQPSARRFQESGELAEDQRPVAFASDLGQKFHQDVQLGRRDVRVGRVDQRSVEACLPDQRQ